MWFTLVCAVIDNDMGHHSGKFGKFTKPRRRRRGKRGLSRDILKSFPLFIFVETVAKLNPEHGDKFEIEIKKIAVVAHVLYTTHNLVISRCRLAENGKEMYHEL